MGALGWPCISGCVLTAGNSCDAAMSLIGRISCDNLPLELKISHCIGNVSAYALRAQVQRDGERPVNPAIGFEETRWWLKSVWKKISSLRRTRDFTKIAQTDFPGSRSTVVDELERLIGLSNCFGDAGSLFGQPPTMEINRAARSVKDLEVTSAGGKSGDFGPEISCGYRRLIQSDILVWQQSI
ncbi:hypothetical protein IWZ00DRAFT_6934 [Phyllosticta capitalensis]|uniref:uncharacterized protein n=1 Tax=Phyllosticta capitalensis TaxID=121624 RepID=UPI0031314DAF